MTLVKTLSNFDQTALQRCRTDIYLTEKIVFKNYPGTSCGTWSIQQNQVEVIIFKTFQDKLIKRMNQKTKTAGMNAIFTSIPKSN